jgi:glyoxalase family protein
MSAPSFPLPAGPSPSPLATPGFHHVGFVSGEADRTLRFYEELLGLRGLDPTGVTALHPPELDGDEPPGPGHRTLLFGGGAGGPGTLVAVRVAPGERRGRWGVGGIHHLALSVRDQDALLRWKRRLRDAGVGSSGPIDRGYFTSLYFQDPDGHILELATEGPGYAIDEAAESLGERFITPPDERVRGHRDEAAIAAAIHPEPVPEITEGMQIGGIHHVTGITDDLSAAHDFHVSALGLRIVKQTANQDDRETKHLFWANYDGSRVASASAMTLFGWPDSDYRARPGVGQSSHVAYRVEAPDTLDAWREHLRELGIPVHAVGDPAAALRFDAPDGLSVELVAPGA